MKNIKMAYLLAAVALVASSALLIGKETDVNQADVHAHEMLDAAREAVRLNQRAIENGEVGFNDEWSRRAMEAERLVAKSPEESRAAVQRYLDRTLERKKQVDALFQAKEISRQEVLGAQYQVAEAKYLLAKDFDHQ